MAAQVDVHGGGEVTITADGETRALAYERAGAVREALLAALETDSAAALTVNVHAREDGALVAGVTEGGALLGTVLFDTDSARIRPGYGPLLDRIAAGRAPYSRPWPSACPRRCGPRCEWNQATTRQRQSPGAQEEGAGDEDETARLHADRDPGRDVAAGVGAGS